MDISAKTALVTGGACGLGLATTTMLAAAGARVVVIDLPNADQSRLNDIEGDVVFAPADVTSEDDVQHAVDIANENHDLAIVVNCAGMLSGFKTAGSKGPFPFEDFTKVINVNLNGTFNVIRLSAQAMLDNPADREERGVIVNTASVAAFDGQLGHTVYAASMAQFEDLTLSVTLHLEHTL